MLPASGHGGARDHGSGTGRLLEAGVSEGRGRSSAFNGLGKHGHVSDPSRKLKVFQIAFSFLPQSKSRKKMEKERKKEEGRGGREKERKERKGKVQCLYSLKEFSICLLFSNRRLVSGPDCL